MRRFLITGGAGSFGTAFARAIGPFVCYSRDPLKHAKLTREFPSIHCIVGDVRDKSCLSETIREFKPNVVIHAAALKHLGAGESNPWPYLSVNAIGTFFVAKACAENGVPTALLLSTDKAVNPQNFYGLTKAFAERIWISMNNRSLSTQFVAIRYGNVFDSRESVLQAWMERRQAGEPLIVRVGQHGESPTRFVLSLDDAVSFAMQAIDAGEGIFVPSELKSVEILSLAQHFSDNIDIVPMLPGEKLHEQLTSSFEILKSGKGALSQVIQTHHEQSSTYNSLLSPRMEFSEFEEKFKHILEAK